MCGALSSCKQAACLAESRIKSEQKRGEICVEVARKLAMKVDSLSSCRPPEARPGENTRMPSLALNKSKLLGALHNEWNHRFASVFAQLKRPTLATHAPERPSQLSFALLLLQKGWTNCELRDGCSDEAEPKQARGNIKSNKRPTEEWQLCKIAPRHSVGGGNCRHSRRWFGSGSGCGRGSSGCNCGQPARIPGQQTQMADSDRHMHFWAM